jgi:hypothetical protein
VMKIVIIVVLVWWYYGDYDGDSESNEGGHLKTVKVIIVTNVCVYINKWNED